MEGKGSDWKEGGESEVLQTERKGPNYKQGHNIITHRFQGFPYLHLEYIDNICSADECVDVALHAEATMTDVDHPIL